MSEETHKPASRKVSLAALLVQTLLVVLSTTTVASDRSQQSTEEEKASVEISFETQLSGLRVTDEDGNSQWLSEIELEAGLSISGAVYKDLHGLSELSANVEHARESESSSETETSVELKQLWAQLPFAQHSQSVRIGLQEFEDERGWWWDTKQWAVTLLADTQTDWNLTFSAITGNGEISTIDEPLEPEEEDIHRLLFQARNLSNESRELAVYGLVTADLSATPAPGNTISLNELDESDAITYHFGLGWYQQLESTRLGSINLRADLALVRGRETQLEFQEENSSTVSGALRATVVERENIQVSGWAVDAAIEIPLNITGEPLLQFGFASGSSGSARFNQTGLHDNGNGVGLYGNIFEPELSNLHILSALLTIPVYELGEFTFYHHRFSRLSGADQIPENELGLEADNNATLIGFETGVHLEIELTDQIEIEFSAAVFQPHSSLDANNENSSQYISGGVSWEF